MLDRIFLDHTDYSVSRSISTFYCTCVASFSPTFSNATIKFTFCMSLTQAYSQNFESSASRQIQGSSRNTAVPYVSIEMM